MSVIYQSKIVEIGASCQEMLEAGMLIIFHENVPAELKDIAAVHQENNWHGEVHVGDKVYLGEQVYTVKKVGNKVNETLHALGHCTIKFEDDGTDLPGNLEVEGATLPILEEGKIIKFESK
ncbi:PTS glucitol/sorbitol transporter subunit IIA [Gracilibacillus alcaliphilus]|uniref:PTS glucitol/sorbitol transporter subunit IIA n=1 Tax=Gracilibacillus alcaliphilus TaxID=1401441 RepID=UPI00195B967D|nr:PTS glucitol/sorbitol transporter subunit IIA [Gracilibacillus alcaliphilus]MBM7676242.1 PTS system glucitol/sorbitol-specific IIA component [Gracilibacillus alcaliphilus]